MAKRRAVGGGGRQQSDDMGRRANRAPDLMQMREVSAARQALEAAVVAPGTKRTLDMLQDPARIVPQIQEQPWPGYIGQLQPVVLS